jgi:hypothetical protein
MTTIGIVTACHTYERFLPAWMQSVKGLHRQPDRVVIAATNPARVVLALSDESYPTDYRVVNAPQPFKWGDTLNAAIEACDTDWIVWIGADDTFLPHALDGWETSTYDIVCFGLQTSKHGYARTISAPLSRAIVCDTDNRNQIPCGSPFKRRIWERTPFDSANFSPYEDWAFAYQTVFRGATVGTTGRVDYTYTIHDGQVSATAPKEEAFATELSMWGADEHTRQESRN